MFNVQECRRFLENQSELTDAQIESLRDDIQDLATVMEDMYLASKESPEVGSDSRGFHERLGHLPEDKKEAALERAAIMEFEGGLERDPAERAALARQIRKGKGF